MLAADRPVDINRLAAAESAAGLYSRSFASAIVEGMPALSPPVLSMLGRALLFKGEFVAALTAEGRAVPSFMTEVLGDSFDPEEWTYRLQISTPSGDRMVVAPAAAVLHLRINSSVIEPWRGRSPLSGAMNEIELAVVAAAALSDEARTKPLAWISGQPGTTGKHMNNEPCLSG